MGVVLSTIRGLRKARGLTQTDVSKELELSLTSYSAKEQVKVDFSATEIGILSKIFNVSPSKFYEEL